MLVPLLSSILLASFASDTLKSTLKDTLSLNAAVVSVKIEPVTVSGDTVSYNATALFLEDDANIEDLLQKIPGLEISGNSIILHGKKIDRLLLNGKDFFGKSTSAALKNMDAAMVKDIKAYARESDFTRLTGVDDGEEENVLDIGIKKNFMDGWAGSASGAYGTSDRYMGRLNANKITKDAQLTAVAGANNLPSKPALSNVNTNTLGNGSAGDRSYWETGVNYSRNKKDMKLSGSAHYEGRYSMVESYNRSQSILASGSSYYVTYPKNDPLYNNFDANFKMEWRIDKMTTFIVEPKLKVASTKSDNSYYFKTSYSADPDTTGIGLDSLGRAKALEKIRNSTTEFFGNSHNDRTKADLALQLTRRFDKKGRSLTFRLTGTYDHTCQSNTDSLFISYYYKAAKPKKYDARPSAVNSLQDYSILGGQISYTEPISKKWYVDAFYKLDWRRSSLDRDVSLYGVHNDDMSSVGVENYIVHNISLAVRYRTKKLNFSLGASLFPQTLDLKYHTDSTGNQTESRTLFNAAPKVNLKYNHSKNSFLKLTYSGWMSNPSVYNLIPVINGTNPLYVHKGNPDLKPSLTQKLIFEYNLSSKIEQQSLVVNLTGTLIQDKTANSTVYVPATGGRIITPVNVDGNWNAFLSTVYNKTFKGNVYSMNANLYCGYRNEVSYLYNNVLKGDELSRMGRFQTNLRVNGKYRKGFLDLSLLLGGQYTNEHSFLRPELTQNPYRVDCGANTGFFLPWNMRIGVDFTFLYQRGYSYDDLNRNYYLLDANVSQSFLKKKLVVSLSGTDLLNSQQNLVRSFSADSRSINIYNGPTRYLLLRVVYKFNFKKK